MRVDRTIALLSGVVALVMAGVAGAQQPPSQLQIGIIDFYGLRALSPDTLRPALAIKEGDPITFDQRPVWLDDTVKRLEAMPGVAHARLNPVCCDNGRVIIYVGIEEAGAPSQKSHAAPNGSARLDAEVVQAGAEFMQALMPAVQRGQAGEDRTKGHSLSNDPAMRAAQERFIGFARTGTPKLIEVLRESSDAHHRALAAQVLAYTENKRAVVNDLVYAMNDPDEGVRNDATRTLLVFTQAVPTKEQPAIQVPYEPFVAMLNSPIWTDRNKSSGALDGLTTSRDPKLLALLRREALTSLAEMARWKSAGHATAGFRILARMSGYSEEDLQRALAKGDREPIIRAALGAK